MNRRAALRLLTGVFCSTGLTGCLTDGEWTVEKVLGWDDPKTPKGPKIPRGQIQMAERVEVLGRKIIAQNTFTGLDPLFNTLGMSDLVLFHRGTAELFISEGLVKRCKTEPELAAVLCSELGQMMAEKQSARGVGRDKDPVPDTSLPDSGLGTKGPKAAEVGRLEKKDPVGSPPAPGETAKLARQLLQGAGFDPAELGRVEPLLKQSDRGEALQKQMAGSALAPTWKE
ncbi:MAG: hypothetical protein JWO38_5827 [Gemmataceae bacterium]|nr:hypothetical protein [Gemmataceae bacterium]